MHISTSSNAPGDLGLIVSQILSALHSAPGAPTPLHTASSAVGSAPADAAGDTLRPAPPVLPRGSSRRGLTDLEQTLVHCDLIRGTASRYLPPQTPMAESAVDMTVPGALRSVQRSLALLNAPLEFAARDAESVECKRLLYVSAWLVVFNAALPVTTAEHRIGAARRLEELRFMLEHVEGVARSLARVVSAELQSARPPEEETAAATATAPAEDGDEAEPVRPRPPAPAAAAPPPAAASQGAGNWRYAFIRRRLSNSKMLCRRRPIPDFDASGHRKRGRGGISRSIASSSGSSGGNCFAPDRRSPSGGFGMCVAPSGCCR
jgi:hypothetical protein